MSDIKYGFEPVFDKNSKLLILGSFPSVKSRKVEFYYGNERNRFWETVCGYFGLAVPAAVEGKKDFLYSHGIALWDIVTECEIEASKDATIKNFKVADVKKLLQNLKIEFIILNGSTAFNIFEKHFGDVGVPYKKLSSTSSANTKFTREEWYDTLRRVFSRT